MTNLNSAFKSIFDEVEEIKYGMTFAEAEADAEAYKQELVHAVSDALFLAHNC